jgi:exodeoxyribonuclease-3
VSLRPVPITSGSNSSAHSQDDSRAPSAYYCSVMRLVSYNILDGGEGRADPLAEVIEAQQPDVVALVEADNAAVVERIASRLKMDFVQATGRRHGAAILSRWPILESINHSLLHEIFSDCVLETTLSTPLGQEWTVAAIHLHPRARLEDESRREQEIDQILKIFAAHRAENRPHILAGDFNANSPIQTIDPLKCKPRTREDIESNNGQLPRTAIQKLLDAGYVDSLQSLHGSAAGKIASFTTQFPGQRVDYIFTHGISRENLIEARIEQDRLAQFASDHFPAILEIEFTGSIS